VSATAGGIQATAVTRSCAVSAARGEIEPNTASASSLPSGVSVTVPPADRPGPLATASNSASSRTVATAWSAQSKRSKTMLVALE
jgi:hypothetical protein